MYISSIRPLPRSVCLYKRDDEKNILIMEYKSSQLGNRAFRTSAKSTMTVKFIVL